MPEIMPMLPTFFLAVALAAASPAPAPAASPVSAEEAGPRVLQPGADLPATTKPVAPAASPGGPGPQPTPNTVIVPPAGIYRPNWETIDPKAPVPHITPGGGNVGLPHYVGLRPTERGLAMRLRDLVGLIEGYLVAERLASARVMIQRADNLVLGAERDHLVLRLHGDWQEPRTRLLDLKARFEQRRRGGVDAESRTLAEAAAKQLAIKVDGLARSWGSLPPKEASKRLDAVNRAVAEAEADPYLVENPAWRAAGAAVLARVDRLERDVAVRVGQGQLLEAILRMADLKRSADARLARGSWDDALGDLAALAEACDGFEHDLRVLVSQGYDPNTLLWIGPDGELRGKAFLLKVSAWRAEGQRRWDVVERARARARIREEGARQLTPPAPPAPPPLQHR